MCAARNFVPGLVALVSHRDIDLDLQDVQGNTVAHVAALVANEETGTSPQSLYWVQVVG